MSGNIKVDDVPEFLEFIAKQVEIDLINAYYNFYSLKNLRDTIRSSKYIQLFKIIDDVINIICEYHGFNMGWSDDYNYISNNIKIKNTPSFSNAVSIKNSMNFDREYDSLLFNEWIDIDCNKKIFNFIFKFCDPRIDRIYGFGFKVPFIFNIGIITKKFISEQYDMYDYRGYCEYKETKHHYRPGYDQFGYSISFEINYNDCDFIFKGKKCINGNNCKISNLNQSYFLFQINLINNKIKIISNDYTFGYQNKSMEFLIPQVLLNTINNSKLFTIGASTYRANFDELQIVFVRKNFVDKK